ncbi:MAG: type II secretion system protein [Fimbriimonadales bacterium]
MRRNAGLKLIELIVVIAILGLLASLILAVAGEVRKRAWEAPCMANLRQVYVAWRNYLDDHHEAFPKHLVQMRPYLKATEVLKCPRDHYGGINIRESQRWGVPVSYFYEQDYLLLEGDLTFYELLAQKDPNHGIMYCLLHGRSRIRTASLQTMPASYLTSGTVLRLRRDGSIQRANAHFVCYRAPDGGEYIVRHAWHLLTDVRPCPPEVCFGYRPEDEVPCSFNW